MNGEKVELRPMTVDDRTAVMDIFNYYIENSFAAFPENPLPYEFYERMMQTTASYPTAVLCDETGEVLGFGFLRAYHPMTAFKDTVEISYFLKPQCTGSGLGRMLFEYLLEGARTKGVKTILAEICSLNENSLKFHQKSGFTECGRFSRVGKKKDRTFGLVWMQYIL